jgi:hypothetical protein
MSCYFDLEMGMGIELKSQYPVDPSTIRRIKFREKISAFLVKRRAWLGGKRLYGIFLAVDRLLRPALSMCNEHLRNVALADKLENHNPEVMGYTPTQEVETFLLYRDEVFGKMPKPTAEYHRDQIETISGILDAGGMEWVLNFGVSYGHVDAILAKKYPHVRFYAVDRSPFVKACNEVDFSDIQNLKFVAADIFDVLDEMSGKGLFFHARTACLLHQDDIVAIYRQARRNNNVAVIAGFEPHGVSRKTFSEYKYSLHGKPVTVPYRRSMYLHNYSLMLKSHGFELTDFRYQRLPSPGGDGSKLTFVARRNA